MNESDTVIKGRQTASRGGQRSYRELVALLYAGQIPTWDVSDIRPAGSRLKDYGGQS